MSPASSSTTSASDPSSATGPTSTSKSEIAYQWLRDRIMTQTYGPGYRIVLSAVAGEIDMSVVPVREAVRRLEAEGLVEFERNVGARVALVDKGAYVDAMETLGVLEGIATALAAPHLTKAQLARAEETNQRMRVLLADFDPHQFTVLNREFHTILFEACPNTQILDYTHRAWAQMTRVRHSTFSFVPGRSKESVEEHQQLLGLIRSGAGQLEVEMAARDHRWRTLKAYLSRQS
ncbi:GntR family transcriptional regulator [Raineyella sp.]|uniref:HTH gntR-type domain-containing protein n=1 Tax=bioreactor metagenome TaxID=1076179 RepID=A0A644XVC8_9ZZZZ|nr:GntR family transcriptional regulator [Raineyella sp.]MEA5155397.1 GntR family transcriptional regulator [Raineyella sp.]